MKQDALGDPQCSMLLVSLPLWHFLLTLLSAARKLLLSLPWLLIC